MKINVRLLLGFCFFLGVILPADKIFSEGVSPSTEQTEKARESYNYSGYNVILISLGNVGTKYMSLYGYDKKTTPFLDEWAKDAVVFEDVYTPASWTLPVGTSLFTSLQPYSHKVYHRRHDNILDKNIPTLQEILKASGYKTAAFTGGLDYDPKFGHMRGFDVKPSNKIFSGFSTTAGQTIKWLNENKDSGKFFLFIHGYDSHCPFTPPPQFKGTFSSAKDRNINLDLTKCYRGWETNDQGKYIAYFKDKIWDDSSILLNQDDIDYLHDLYLEEVLFEDFIVGRFLGSLDKQLLSKTIIIVFADHGELFDKNGRFGRAGTIRGTNEDVVVHIPLIIKFPNKQAKRVEGLVQLIDLMPTVLKILDIPAPAHIQGKNLLPMIDGDPGLNPYVFGGTKYWPTRHYPYMSRSEYIRDKQWKLIHENRRKLKVDFKWMEKYKDKDQLKLSDEYQEYIDKQEKNPTYAEGPEDTYQLYDILNDPDEKNDVLKNNPVIAKQLKDSLSAWVNNTSAYNVHNSSEEIFNNKKLKMIREGGYW